MAQPAAGLEHPNLPVSADLRGGSFDDDQRSLRL